MQIKSRILKALNVDSFYLDPFYLIVRVILFGWLSTIVSQHGYWMRCEWILKLNEEGI